MFEARRATCRIFILPLIQGAMVVACLLKVNGLNVKYRRRRTVPVAAGRPPERLSGECPTGAPTARERAPGWVGATPTRRAPVSGPGWNPAVGPGHGPVGGPRSFPFEADGAGDEGARERRHPSGRSRRVQGGRGEIEGRNASGMTV